jgi:hypothetical protein
MAGVAVALVPHDRDPRTKDGGGLPATTDASGSFSIGDVPPGLHRLHVPGALPSSVDVSEGATVDLPATTVSSTR